MISRSATQATRLALAAMILLLALSSAEAANDARAQAQEILTATGVTGGLVVHVGCGDGALTAALRANERFVVHGLNTDAARVAKARAHVHARGIQGAVTVSTWDGTRLPFPDNLANLVVAEQPGALPMSEVMRILCPHGVAYVKHDATWTKTVKPRPKDIDDWTHYLHDASGNAVARDARVGPPREMQWLADPAWSRNHHTLASISAVVSTGGRILYIVDEGPAGAMSVPPRWFVVARDAFNGVLLWKRPIPDWAYHRRKFRSGPVQLPRTLVAEGGSVYVPLGASAPLSILDAATGKTLHTCKGTDGTEEIIVHGGTAFAVCGAPVSEQAAIDPKRAKSVRFPNQKAIVAVQAETGTVRWRWSPERSVDLVPVTLAAAGQRVFCQAGQGVVCLDARTGKPAWSTPGTSFKPDAGNTAKSKGRKRGKGQGSRSMGWSVSTLVVHDGVVLWANGSKLTALATATGKTLWNCPCRPGFKSPTDVFVANGLVWLGSDFSQGRDLKTGEVKKTNSVFRDLRTAGHHHRCYREKATDRYIMSGHRGIEFMDLVGTNHSRNNWIRGLCQYGILPCNGLIYTPPNACGCYMEGLLHGFWAVSAGGTTQETPRPPTAPTRLQKGPAYAQVGNRKSPIGNPTDWPTLRHDAVRSGSTTAELPAKLSRGWEAEVGGRVSAPVAAEGLVLVAAVDKHEVVAFDAADGTRRWSFLAGGRVDSPPTVHCGLALFGCADGRVYCLRAADGELVWSFQAAPTPRRTVVRDQVESVWPVHGSVLIEGGVAYASAGRYSYLDGGIALYGLDPQTGRVACHSTVRVRHPKGTEGLDKAPRKNFVQNATDGKTFAAPDQSDGFSMYAARSDVLVSDGTSIYLRQIRFDRNAVQQDTLGRHLFSTSRLLDDAENHRSHWVLGTGDFSRLPVAYSWIANGTKPRWGVRLAEPYGLMLAFDGHTAWGVRRGAVYTLYAAANRPFSPGEKPRPDFRKGDDPSQWKATWQTNVPLRPRAIVRAGDAVLLGGTPGLGSTGDAFGAFEGREHGVLLVASAADGRTRATHKLAAPPVWDGMAVARGRLYLSTVDGKVVCWTGAP